MNASLGQPVEYQRGKQAGSRAQIEYPRCGIHVPPRHELKRMTIELVKARNQLTPEPIVIGGPSRKFVSDSSRASTHTRQRTRTRDFASDSIRSRARTNISRSI